MKSAMKLVLVMAVICGQVTSFTLTKAEGETPAPTTEAATTEAATNEAPPATTEEAAANPEATTAPATADGETAEAPAVSPAEDINSEKYANILRELGIYKDEDFKLDEKVTKEKAAVIITRLLGAEKEALENNISTNFTDVDEWAKPYVGYLHEKNVFKGTNDTTYGAKNDVTGQQYIVLLLRTMGLSDVDGRDFTYSNPYDIIGEKKLFPEDTQIDFYKEKPEFTGHDCVYLTYKALKALKTGESGNDVAKTLVDKGVIDDAAYDKLLVNNEVAVGNEGLPTEGTVEPAAADANAADANSTEETTGDTSADAGSTETAVEEAPADASTTDAAADTTDAAAATAEDGAKKKGNGTGAIVAILGAGALLAGFLAYKNKKKTEDEAANVSGSTGLSGNAGGGSSNSNGGASGSINGAGIAGAVGAAAVGAAAMSGKDKYYGLINYDKEHYFEDSNGKTHVISQHNNVYDYSIVDHKERSVKKILSEQADGIVYSKISSDSNNLEMLVGLAEGSKAKYFLYDNGKLEDKIVTDKKADFKEHGSAVHIINPAPYGKATDTQLVTVAGSVLGIDRNRNMRELDRFSGYVLDVAKAKDGYYILKHSKGATHSDSYGDELGFMDVDGNYTTCVGSDVLEPYIISKISYNSSSNKVTLTPKVSSSNSSYTYDPATKQVK